MYFALAYKYLTMIEECSEENIPPTLIEGFERNFAKLPLYNQTEFFQKILATIDKTVTREDLLPIIECQVERTAMRLAKLNQIPHDASSTTSSTTYMENLPSVQEMDFQDVEQSAILLSPIEEQGKDKSVVVSKIIEDCDRPWAMTSDSFYGMFPADWSEEAKQLPEFIIESTENDLAKRLAISISNNEDEFLAACFSITSLKNKPMSSPWFDVAGGRLSSNIKYKLSAKGNMFVRLLKTVKSSNNNSEKTKKLIDAANKTLEKIDFILEKN
jgi:hypothetical protein